MNKMRIMLTIMEHACIFFIIKAIRNSRKISG